MHVYTLNTVKISVCFVDVFLFIILGLEHTHHDLRDNYVSELHITSQLL